MKSNFYIHSIRTVCAILVTIFFLITLAQGQSQDQDLQQMKAKLQQLEQEMQELKAQINNVQQAPAPAAPKTTVIVRATEEAQETPAAPKEDKKNSIDLYGHVMMDSGYEFGQSDPNWFDVMRPTKLASFKGQFAPDGKVYFSVRQTRFGVKTSTPTSLGNLNTIFEFELFRTGVDQGQTTFRLRHAYGELGHDASGTLQGVKPKFDMPDFSWQVRVMRPWGHVQVAGIFRKISWVNTAPNPPVDLGGDALGWGINVTSNINFTKKDVGRFAVVYGEGVENYMNDAPIDVGVKSNLSNPNKPIVGVPLPVLGVVTFLDHNWNSHFSTSIGYSLVNISNSNAETPSDYHQGHYALTNLLYHPVPSVMVGGEFIYGRRVNFSDGFNVNDSRLQFSFKYDWKKGFAF